MFREPVLMCLYSEGIFADCVYVVRDKIIELRVCSTLILRGLALKNATKVKVVSRGPRSGGLGKRCVVAWEDGASEDWSGCILPRSNSVGEAGIDVEWVQDRMVVLSGRSCRERKLKAERWRCLAKPYSPPLWGPAEDEDSIFDGS